MANLKDIRRRIGSVKSTRQITRAMKLVAAAKMRRAQEATSRARPYSYQIYGMLLALAKSGDSLPPLLQEREEKKVKLVVLAGDRGLCGSFNSSVFKRAENFIASKSLNGVEVVIETIGKKSDEYFGKTARVSRSHPGLIASPDFSRVGAVADLAIASFLDGQVDAIYLCYNEFQSAIAQVPVVERLVPLGFESLPESVVERVREQMHEDSSNLTGPLLEPSREVLLKELLSKHFRTQLYRAVLESVSSEHAARMSAMENATNNAGEVIDKLTLEYNKARQASITKELMEIVGGVEAMK